MKHDNFSAKNVETIEAKEDECLVLGCKNKQELRVEIAGKSIPLYVCKECAKDYEKHPKKVGRIEEIKW